MKTTYRHIVSLKIIMMVLFLLPALSFGQKENKLLRQGNKNYEKGNYKEAEMDYRKALEMNSESKKGQFNLGTSLYKQKNWDESARIFGTVSGSNVDQKTKANALHNLGNSLVEAKQYDKSIEAYENALLNNPSDKDTKYNLEYAKMMLKKQQQQQQQKQNDKNQQKKDDKDKKDKQDQNKDQQKEQSQNKSQQDQNKKITKEDADRMLEALKNNEKKTLVKLNKQKNKNNQQVVIEKDW
jgi:Ca-activated chloride channel homolog